MTVSNENSKDVFDIDSGSVMLQTYTFDSTDPSEVFIELFVTDGSSLGRTWTRVTSSSPAHDEYYVDTDNLQVTIGGAAGTIQAEYGSTVEKLVISRVLPLTQSTALPNATALSTPALEAALDGLTLIAQQIQEQLNRSIVRSPTDTSGEALEFPAADDGKGLMWNASGDLVNTSNDISTIDDSATSAAESAASAAEAAASAATVNLPAIAGGDATKHLQVNAGETGYDHVTLASLSADKLPLAGGVMTGAITGLSAPSAGDEAANRDYVLAQAALHGYFVSGDTISIGVGTGQTISTINVYQDLDLSALSPGPGAAISMLYLQVELITFSSDAVLAFRPKGYGAGTTLSTDTKDMARPADGIGRGQLMNFSTISASGNNIHFFQIPCDASGIIEWTTPHNASAWEITLIGYIK